jgi:hypothetical protein
MMAGRAVESDNGGSWARRALRGLPRNDAVAVALEPLRPGTLPIARVGELNLSAGYLVYVGSALGPGEVASRFKTLNATPGRGALS